MWIISFVESALADGDKSKGGKRKLRGLGVLSTVGDLDVLGHDYFSLFGLRGGTLHKFAVKDWSQPQMVVGSLTADRLNSGVDANDWLTPLPYDKLGHSERPDNGVAAHLDWKSYW